MVPDEPVTDLPSSPSAAFREGWRLAWMELEALKMGVAFRAYKLGYREAFDGVKTSDPRVILSKIDIRMKQREER